MGGSLIYRIRALKDFGDVEAGEMGGFVASEENLSHDGTCWIYGDAMVYHSAKVKDNAYVSGHIMVSQGTISNSTVLFGVGEINFDINAGDDWTFYRNPCAGNGFITTSTKIDIWNYRHFSGTAEEFIDMFERVDPRHQVPGELEFIKALVKFHRDLYFKA